MIIFRVTLNVWWISKRNLLLTMVKIDIFLEEPSEIREGLPTTVCLQEFFDNYAKVFIKRRLQSPNSERERIHFPFRYPGYFFDERHRGDDDIN